MSCNAPPPDVDSIPPEAQEKLFTLNLLGRLPANQCDLKENRYRDSEYGTYCWFGRVRKDDNPEAQGSCSVGTVCSPHSFSDARTRFCLSLGCEPFKFVHDPCNIVGNRRGGITVYNKLEECSGLNGALGCVTGGVKESIKQITTGRSGIHPALSIGAFLIFLFIAAMVVVRYRQKKGKKKLSAFFKI